MRRGTISAGSRAGSDIGDGWITIKIKDRSYNASRLAWWFSYDEYPDFIPFPKNGIRSDIRIKNLQHVNEHREKFSRIITHVELLEVLYYDPIVGVFIWKRWMSSKARVGDIAGTIQDGYTNIRIYGRGYKAGRLAWFYMYGVWPIHQIDHGDRAKSNNGIANLDDVTSKMNCANRDQSFNKTEEYRQKQSELTKKRWADPLYREEQSRKLKEAWRRRKG